MDSFKIQSIQDLYNLLGKSEDELINILNNKKIAYHKYNIKKHSGIREIYSLSETHQLYKVQKRFNKYLQLILLPEAVFGFRKGKSYYDFLYPHLSKNKNRYFLRLDISDFFDSIKIADVKECLNYYISDEIDDEERKQIIDYIIDIVSLDNKIVQGAITSPALSNIVFRSLDIRIEKYCHKLGIIYTRYADDMLFSSNSSYLQTYKFINAIQHIINSKSFKLNLSKTLKYKNELSVNGYVVGSSIRLSRKKLQRINRIIFNLEQSSFKGFKDIKSLYKYRNVLSGYRSFLIQAIRYFDDEKKITKTKNKITEIEYLIDKYCKTLKQ